MQGDLNKAGSHAQACLLSAERTRSRKYIAWGHKLQGDIATLEDRVEKASSEYEEALQSLSAHPCPLIEWRILKAMSDLAEQRKDSGVETELRAKARAVVESLADSLEDDELRRNFLKSEPIRTL